MTSSSCRYACNFTWQVLWCYIAPGSSTHMCDACTYTRLLQGKLGRIATFGSDKKIKSIAWTWYLSAIPTQHGPQKIYTAPCLHTNATSYDTYCYSRSLPLQPLCYRYNLLARHQITFFQPLTFFLISLGVLLLSPLSPSSSNPVV